MEGRQVNRVGRVTPIKHLFFYRPNMLMPFIASPLGLYPVFEFCLNIFDEPYFFMTLKLGKNPSTQHNFHFKPSYKMSPITTKGTFSRPSLFLDNEQNCV